MRLTRADIPPWLRIDELGRVWTTRNRNGRGYGSPERRAEWVSWDGHLQVQVLNRTRLAHRLVYAWFNGEAPADVVIRHLNGRPDDNRPENLEPGNQADNAADSIRHGTMPRGERRYGAVLTESAVREIRRRYANGEQQTKLAKEFGVSRPTISLIVNRRKWAHVS